MTNPDNIVRMGTRLGGRGSIQEENAWAQVYSAGILAGVGAKQNPNPGMTVLVGGTTTSPDVVIATGTTGYKVALDIVGQKIITVAAPATNSRITSIVAYTDALTVQSTETNVTGSPKTCGLIIVNGTAAANPQPPTDTQIRQAITSDGATGSQAYYGVVANVKIDANTTTITDSLITNVRSNVSYGLAKKPSFSVYKSITTGFNAGDNVVVFDKKDYDDLNMYNATTGNFIIPVDGKYHITMQVGVGSAGISGAAHAHVFRNGEVIRMTQKDVGSGSEMKLLRFHLSFYEYLKKDDTLSVHVWCSESRNIDGNRKYTFLQVEMVGV